MWKIFLDKSLLPWPKKLRQSRIMTKRERCSMRSITSAGRKSCLVAVRWAPIVRDRARYHTIEQRPIDIMILGRLIFFFGQVVEAQCRKKNPRRSPGLNHTAPNRIADQKHCALSAQPNPCLHVQKRFIGEFRRRLSYRYRRPRRMLIMDKQKPYGSSPGFSRVFSRHWGSRLLCRKISFHVLLSYPGQPFSF